MRAPSAALAPCLLAFACGAGAAPAVAYSGCATADLDEIVKASKTSKIAQRRLADEFAGRKLALDRLGEQVAAQEAAVQKAREGSTPEQQAKAADALKAGQLAWQTDKALYDADLAARKQVELDRVLNGANLAYRTIGTRGGFAKLFQAGGDEPVYVMGADATDFPCTDKMDVTRDVIRELDRHL